MVKFPGRVCVRECCGKNVARHLPCVSNADKPAVFRGDFRTAESERCRPVFRGEWYISTDGGRGEDAEEEQPPARAADTVDADVCHQRVSRLHLLCRQKEVQNVRQADYAGWERGARALQENPAWSRLPIDFLYKVPRCAQHVTMSVIDNSTTVGKVLQWANQNQDNAVLFSGLAGGGILLLMCICCALGALMCPREYQSTGSDDY